MNSCLTIPKISLVFLLSLFLLNPAAAEKKNTRPNEPGPWPSIQVNTYTGNLFYQRSDLFIPCRGDIDLNLLFWYNSLKNTYDCGYGNGWSFSFGMHYTYFEDDFTVYREEGKEDVFTWDGSGFVPPIGVYDALTEYEPGKYLLRTKYGIKYYFEDDSHTQLTKIEDRNGNQIILSYTGGKPTTITDPSGRMLYLAWVSGHLSQITDPNTTPGRVIAFQYDDSWNMVQVTRPMNNVWHYGYNENGPMSSMTDPLANSVIISYDANQAVAGLSLATLNYAKTFSYDNCDNTTTVNQTVSSVNRQTIYTFDLSGKITSKQFPDGNSVSFSWDSQDNMIAFTSETGSATSYSYDAKGNLLSKINCLGSGEYFTYEGNYNKVSTYLDRNGNLTSYGYDIKGNQIRITDCFNNSEWFTYDTFGNRITDKDKNNKTTSYSYDLYGNLTGLTDPLLFSESRTYDLAGNLLSKTDKRGLTSTYSYDLFDRNVLITDPLGYLRSFTWDANGNMTGETNQNGQLTSFSYDPANRLVMTTDANGGIFTAVYDEAGNVISETNANGSTTVYTFNTRDWRTMATDCLGNSQTFTYNAEGFLLSYSDKGGNSTNFTYNCVGDVMQATDPNGFTESFTYDGNGNRTSLTNKNGITTAYVYDCLNRLSAINYPLGYSEIMGYDAEDNRTSFTDKNGNSTAYSYDPLGRLLTVTDPIGLTEFWTYDGEGNKIIYADKNGNQTYFTYDGLGRIVLKTDPPPFGFTESFTYDGVGNMLTSTDRRGNTTVRYYDNLNRKTLTVTPMGFTEITTYDAIGNITGITNKNGFTTTFAYDCLGQKISTTDPMSFIESYTYNANGNMIGHTDKNLSTTTWNYSCCRLLSKTDPLLFTESYGYDNVGNRTSVTNKNNDVTTYTYDLLDRMTGITTPMGHQTLYTFNGNGNVLSRSDPNLNTTNYIYNNRGELITTNYPDGTSLTYTYNNNGDLILAVNTGGLGETITYTLDALGRISSKVTNYGLFSTIISYTYDQNGNNLTLTSGTGTISYLYDNDERLVQITDQNGGVTTLQHDAMGQPIVVNYPNGVSTFTTYDPNGNKTSVMTQTTPPPQANNPEQPEPGNNIEIPSETLEGIDYGIIEIISPVSGPGLGEAEPVIVTVMNFGSVVLPGIILSYTLDDITFSEFVLVPIPPMGIHVHIFSQPADLSEPGHTYLLTACVMAEGDMDLTNDCMTSMITNMIVVTMFDAISYEYNPNGLKTWEGRFDGSTVSYTYSLRNELLSEQTFPAGDLIQYTYTPTGKRHSKAVNGIIALNGYNDDDELINSSGLSYTLDDNGNRTETTGPDGDVITYGYGFENELIEVGTPDGPGTQYYYSSLGTQLAVNENGIMTYYLSNGNDVINEFNAAGIPTCSYNPGVSVNYGGQTGYYYYDRSGTSTLQMGADQTVIATARFDEFGNITNSSGTWLNNLMLFRTKDLEPAIGFINLDNGLFYDNATNSFPGQSNYISNSFSYLDSWFRDPPITETVEEYIARIVRSAIAEIIETVKHCCCCVNDLRTPVNMVKNNKPGGPYSIKFDTEIDLEYKIWNQNFDGDCTFEWWEKSPDPPEWQHVPANNWNNMTQVPATAPSFNHSWNCRKKPCPGVETVVDTDEPGFSSYGNAASGTLNVMFEITVKSTPNCDCTIQSISRYFETNFEIKNGKPTRDEPEFINGLPPDQIRPR